MKATYLAAPALIAIAGLMGGHAASQAEVSGLVQEKGQLEERVGQLESKLTELDRRLEHLAGEASKRAGDAEKTVLYLRRQALAAKSTIATLEKVEQHGFTAGINPRSREILLSGLREAAREAQAGLPGEPDPAPAPRR